LADLKRFETGSIAIMEMASWGSKPGVHIDLSPTLPFLDGHWLRAFLGTQKTLAPIFFLLSS
jgi:hypothetical protein